MTETIQPGPCILPFADCTFRDEAGQCTDLNAGPWRTEAGCFVIQWLSRDNMVRRARSPGSAISQARAAALCMWPGAKGKCGHPSSKTALCSDKDCPVKVS